MRFKTIHCETTLTKFRELYYQFSKNYTHSYLFDSCGLSHTNTKSTGFYSMGFGTKNTITYHKNQLTHCKTHLDNSQTIHRQIIHSFDILKAYLEAEQPKAHPNYPDEIRAESLFINGWAGALGYELSNLIEPTTTSQYEYTETTPQLIIFEPKHTIGWLPESKQILLASADETWLNDTLLQLMGEQAIQPNDADMSFKVNLHPQTTATQFEKQVEQLLAHIIQGDVYQANLSIPFISNNALPLSSCLKLYETLVNINPSPFSGLFITPEVTIISNSPERLVQYDATNKTLQTLPIAGTRGRGKTADEDNAIGTALLENTKEQAEHLMLVDLLRNDLGKVAEPASVSVPNAFFLERYSHVTHLVSEVVAQKRPDCTIWDVLASVFPGGTITGCPKVRCMEILSTVETQPRGFYTGSMGYIDARGHSDWNILIRSLFNDPINNKLSAHFGAGIVADSTPENEYKECFRKYGALDKALTSLACGLESGLSTALQ